MRNTSLIKSKINLITAVIFILTSCNVNCTSITQQTAIIRDIRDDFLEPSSYFILGRLSQAVYSVNKTFYKPITESLFTFQCDENCTGDDNNDDILNVDEKYDSSSVKIIDWIDRGSTEVLIMTLREKHDISHHNQNETNKTMLIVTFRGTEEIQDWIVNLNSSQVLFGSPHHMRGIPKDMIIPESTLNGQTQSFPSASTMHGSSLPILTHAGFNQVFRLYDEIVSHIQPILKNMDTIYVTGHSLGVSIMLNNEFIPL